MSRVEAKYRRRSRTVDGTAEKVYYLIDKWTKRLGLQHWDIRVRFDYHGDGYAAMDCTSPEYEVATIWINSRRCRKELWTEAQFDSIVLHELVHVKIAKMAELLPDTEEAIKLEESCVTGLTEALLAAEEEGS